MEKALRWLKCNTTTSENQLWAMQLPTHSTCLSEHIRTSGQVGYAAHGHSGFVLTRKAVLVPSYLSVSLPFLHSFLKRSFRESDQPDEVDLHLITCCLLERCPTEAEDQFSFEHHQLWSSHWSSSVGLVQIYRMLRWQRKTFV